LAKKYGKYIVVENRKEIKTYSKIKSIIYSPNGKGYAFVAEKNGKWIVVRD